MAMISFFTTIVGVFALQAVQAQTTLPYGYDAYTNLLSAAPHYTPCEIPWMGYLDVSIYQQMSLIADKYNFRPSDIAQWYNLIQNLCPSYTDMDLYESLSIEFREEMLARNIPYMPQPINCNPLRNSGPHSPPAMVDPLATPAAATSPYDLPYRNSYAMMDRQVPRLTYGTENSIRQLLNSYLPSQCWPQNPLLANQIGTNMRYSLSMAEKELGGLYYPFY